MISLSTRCGWADHISEAVTLIVGRIGDKETISSFSFFLIKLEGNVIDLSYEQLMIEA